MSDPIPEPTLFGLPLNRIVAFLGPHISWLAGIVATWATVHVHLLATFHVGSSDVAKAIAQAIVFGVVTGVTYAGQHKWLDGLQKWAYGVGKGIAEQPLPATYNPAEFGPVDPEAPAVAPPGAIG